MYRVHQLGDHMEMEINEVQNKRLDDDDPLQLNQPTKVAHSECSHGYVFSASLKMFYSQSSCRPHDTLQQVNHQRSNGARQQQKAKQCMAYTRITVNKAP